MTANLIAQYPTSSGGGAGSVTLIQNQTLGTAAASVTFSGIPQTYTNLMLVVNTALSGVSVTEFITAQFNGDATSDYTNGYILNSGGTVSGNSNVGTSLNIGGAGPVGGSIQAIVSGYASTIVAKSATSTSACASSTGLTQVQGGGTWNQTAAITSIVLAPTSGSFIAGSTFSLYGLQ